MAEDRGQAARVIFVGVGQDDGLEAARGASAQVGHDARQAGVGIGEAGAGVHQQPAAGRRADGDGVPLSDVDRHDLQGAAAGQGAGCLAGPEDGAGAEPGRGDADQRADAPGEHAGEDGQRGARAQKERLARGDEGDGAGHGPQQARRRGHGVQEALGARTRESRAGQAEQVEDDGQEDAGDGGGDQRREQDRRREREEGDLAEVPGEHGGGEERCAQAGRNGWSDPAAAAVSRPAAEDPLRRDEDAGGAGDGELEAGAGGDRGVEQDEHQHGEAEGAERSGGSAAETAGDEGRGHPGGAGGRRGRADGQHVRPDAGGHPGGAGPRRRARQGGHRAQEPGDHAHVEA